MNNRWKARLFKTYSADFERSLPTTRYRVVVDISLLGYEALTLFDQMLVMPETNRPVLARTLRHYIKRAKELAKVLNEKGF